MTPSSFSPAHTDAPVIAALARLSSSDLLGFLTKQRWFAAKSATPEGARVANVAVLPWGDGAFAIARVVVALGRGGGASTVVPLEQTYQLPLGACASVSAEVSESALIATVDAGARLTLYDAVYDPSFRRGLVDALSRALATGETPADWIIEPVGAVSPPSPFAPGAPTALSAAEQSNTSIIIDDVAIVKLFRMLKPGIHPDVEVARFLTTHANFANTPALLAAIRFDDGAESTTAGMVQAYLPGAVDAWSYALDRGHAYFTAPIDQDPLNEFVADAKRLGEITRDLHESLASDDDDPAFAPDAATPEDLDRWAHRTQQSTREALALLERRLTSPDFPEGRLAEARALVKRRDHYIALINEIDDTAADDLGSCVRVHGDYHLGQVLRTATPGGEGDFMIIDFEGEPSRSLAERREKTSPLRDVAGMLRSFAYAAATLAMSAGRSIDTRTREVRAARWERDVRKAFLEGYLATRDDGAEILPEDAGHVQKLIALFEAEKVFYELAYELNNRPTWVGIPMRGISKLLTVSG
jgi:maltose alpha-D-glucosyltransferase/alpha-amylase